jgi:hypothetical protein
MFFSLPLGSKLRAEQTSGVPSLMEASGRCHKRSFPCYDVQSKTVMSFILKLQWYGGSSASSAHETTQGPRMPTWLSSYFDDYNCKIGLSWTLY